MKAFNIELRKRKGKRAKKVGMPPGSLVPTTETPPVKPVITILDYNADMLEERVVTHIDECGGYKSKPTVTWINVDGVHDVELIQTLGTQYDLHPLTQEDILNTDQRPKLENMGHYLYIVLRMIYFSNEQKDITTEQVSFIVGSGFLLTFQEEQRSGDVFDFVRDRIRSNRSRLRKLGSDYLAYALIDAVVDYYFVVLEELGEKIEKLEKKLIFDPSSEILGELYVLKRTMLSLRRAVWPLRETLSGFEKEESTLVHQSTLLYLRDVYGHVVQIIDTIEILRETLGSMIEIYLSSVSYKLNMVMKVLTILTTIFMPLTFISSIYGMNFKHMPELEWVYGYPMAISIMFIIAILMLIAFKIKRWI